MRITESFSRQRSSLLERTLPPLREVEQAVGRVLHRWPDAVAAPADNDRERLAIEFLSRVARWDWERVPVSRLLQAAVAAFDEKRAGRADLAPLHAFLLAEVETTKIASFLAGMFWVYVGSFAPGAAHTEQMAVALSKRLGTFGERTDALISRFPDLLNPRRAPVSLTKIMGVADDPYLAVRDIGFPSPHAPGLMSHVHTAFIEQISGKLHEVSEQERLFFWLAPKTRDALQTGAERALSALLLPWTTKVIRPDRQSRLSEWIVANYGDPRTQRGGIWPGFDPKLKDVLLRWLTKEDMNFFCDVVSATQNSHMWPPRRKFWMRLHERGNIDQAWVAFGSDAKEYARANLMREGTSKVNSRFGSQKDRGGSTSLLIMQIGRKIVVDGCHSYKTHIFDSDDPKAPKLYQTNYYCDDIMRASRTSQSHVSIPSWESWVHRHI